MIPRVNEAMIAVAWLDVKLLVHTYHMVWYNVLVGRLFCRSPSWRFKTAGLPDRSVPLCTQTFFDAGHHLFSRDASPRGSSCLYLRVPLQTLLLKVR